MSGRPPLRLAGPPLPDLAALEAGLPEMSPEDLAELSGRLGRLQGLVTARLAQTSRRPPAVDRTLKPLLSVQEVRMLLGVSEGEVYRRAKTDLKSASVVLGPGSLRFDPERVRKFIRSRAG